MSELTTLTRAEGTTFSRFSVAARPTPGSVGDRQIPVVVLAPAMGMPASYYDRFLEAIGESGLHAVSYEQRGHEAGGQPAGWRRNFGYAELIEDLVQVIDSARADRPGSPVIVLGHSLGGQVAVAAIGEHPGLYDGLALVASATPHWKHWSPRVLLASVLFPVIAYAMGHFPGDRLKFAGREARTVITEWSKLALTGRFPLGEPGMATAKVPVLAISIDNDWIGVAPAVDALCAKLPDATVTRLHISDPGIDHFKWARRPETVLPAMVAWAWAAPAVH